MDLERIKGLESLELATYFRLLVSVAHADGTLSSEEKSFLEDQGELMGYDVAPLLTEPPSLESLDLSAIPDFTKRLVLRDCISLAFVDGNYDEKEQKRIATLAQNFGISMDTVKKIEQWLQRYWSLMEEGESLFA